MAELTEALLLVKVSARHTPLPSLLRSYTAQIQSHVSPFVCNIIVYQTRKSQRSGDLDFLREAEEETGGTSMENAIKELRAAHAETIQELEKTRSLLSTESRISQGYKVEQTHPPTFILTVCKAARGGVRVEPDHVCCAEQNLFPFLWPQAELDAALRKMDADKLEYGQKLERQAQLLDARATKIRKLEGSRPPKHPSSSPADVQFKE